MSRHCKYCGKDLEDTNKAGKVLKTCEDCAQKIRDKTIKPLFKGQFKKSAMSIGELTGVNITGEKLKAATSNKYTKRKIKRELNKLRKKLKKEGYTEGEIEEEIKKGMNVYNSIPK